MSRSRKERFPPICPTPLSKCIFKRRSLACLIFSRISPSQERAKRYPSRSIIDFGWSNVQGNSFGYGVEIEDVNQLFSGEARDKLGSRNGIGDYGTAALMLNSEAKRNSASELFVDGIFELFILIFSLCTLLAHLFMLAGFSFYTLFYVYSAAVLPISFFYLKKTRLFSLKTETSVDFRVIIIISVLALAGALLSLLSIRPDADDVNYLSRAVYYFENPRVPLDFEFHNHAPAGFDFRSLLFTFPVIELFWTYLAMVFNVHPLGVYHFAAPALGGAMIPLAWFLLLSKFTDNQKAAALGTAVIMAYLRVDGITHRSFGNFAFVRIWQGKVMVLAIVLPLLAAYSLDFLSNSKSRYFLKLVMLGITAVGLAYTAF